VGLEPTRPKDTWPSTMPVYQFQHSGKKKLSNELNLILSFDYCFHLFRKPASKPSVK
jgi:hypothetical protein